MDYLLNCLKEMRLKYDIEKEKQKIKSKREITKITFKNSIKRQIAEINNYCYPINECIANN